MPVKTRAIEKIKRDTVLKKKDLAAGPNETQTKKAIRPQPNGFLKSNKNPALPVRSRLNPSKDRVGKTASRFQAPFVRKAREVCCPPQEKESRSKRVGFILSAD